MSSRLNKCFKIIDYNYFEVKLILKINNRKIESSSQRSLVVSAFSTATAIITYETCMKFENEKKISFTLYHGRLIISVENNKCLKIQGSGVQKFEMFMRIGEVFFEWRNKFDETVNEALLLYDSMVNSTNYCTTVTMFDDTAHCILRLR
ncbi:hypothetical protein DERP_002937 [Dermatophagoides pteronyssinus]|uniref:Uncharacterized protein n=1 Tax=Dermatophagoides pteronyssinus TaxID=6956 RepID=A0ABQ8JX67_DERPT|nr:hypothetical protein DERP_002937 [Dermatophagoides pteronyssinus]